MASTRRMGPDGIGIKKMDVDGVSSKRSAVDEDDVEGHASRRSAPDGVNRRADADGLTSSKRSAVDEDDVEGHMIGAMNPILARDLARAKKRDVQRAASRGNLISEAKRAIRRKD